MHELALVTSDLMFSASVAGAAASQPAKLHVVASLADLLKLCAAKPLKLVIVDLSTPGLDAVNLPAELQRSVTTPPAMIAYAPHVHGGMLAAARDAGYDEVLTRGQFHSQMAQVIGRHLT